MLIGRDLERRRLLETMKSDKSEFVAVFGRRRIGKTFLVQETFGNSFSFVHTGLAREGMRKQLAEFRYSLEQFFGVRRKTFGDWSGAFHALQESLDGLPSGKKVVFIDEMPWMDTPRSGFVSALEHFWNGWACFRKDIILIVCGSATSWIISKVINDHGGLHNRVTMRMPLRPFTLSQCEEMVKKRGLRLDRRQILEGYMAMGGVPFYWDRIRKGESMAQSMDRLFVAKDAEFSGEFDRLYASLFKNPGIHVGIVTALADRMCGKTRRELLADLKAEDNGAFSKALLELEECGFIERSNLPGRIRRDSLYRLVDNYSLFYFKFIRGTASRSSDHWQRMATSQTGRIWCGLAFERVCMAHIDQVKKALGISGVMSEVYAWRHKSGSDDDRGAQIDLIIDRKDGVANICEVKYSAGKFVISGEYAENLARKIEAFSQSQHFGKSVFLTMITPCGVKENEHSGVVQSEVTLDDLFAR